MMYLIQMDDGDGWRTVAWEASATLAHSFANLIPDARAVDLAELREELGDDGVAEAVGEIHASIRRTLEARRDLPDAEYWRLLEGVA
jgi:hypothetical protein